MPNKMCLEINQLECSSIIGCLHFERNQPQPIIVSLRLELGDWNGQDQIEATVNYWSMCDYVKELVSSSHYHLLESLAQEISAKILANYPLVQEVTVTLNKPAINHKKAHTINCHYQQRRTFKVALALGSNLNNPYQQIISATELLADFITNLKLSPIYRSRPHGYTEQDDFYNCCISGDTELTPTQLLTAIKKLEKLMGKLEQFANGPRIIDIDIIFYEQLQLQQHFLTIPHPRMHQRDFVLQPLADIEPEWYHPQFQQQVAEILAKLPQTNQYIISAQQ